MAAAKGDDDDDGAFPGYPEPYVKQSYKSVAGYLPEAEGYDDIAVLSILSFTPMGVALSDLANLNMTDFILEGRDVIVELFEAAKKEGRDKLILDLSTNGGGSILLAQEVYRLLFPDGKFTSYDRFRANDAIKASVEAQYEQFVVNLIDSNWPLGPRDADIQRGDKFFGPYIAAGQNVTAPFITNLTQELAPDTWLNGNEPDPRDTLIPEPYFDPENILIITDGTCASACGILTGLLTRNHGVRTLALGGRATRLPMQAMGGVKGTIVNMNSDIRKAFTSIYTSAAMDSDASEILKDAEDALPVVASEPPLMPLNRGDGGGRVNGRNGYTLDDLDGYPVHFRYEAANCRLFYTPLMMADVRETWRRAADAAWYGAPCVHGSTANEDNTISDELPEYDSRVRSRVPGIKGPGSLED